MDLQHIIWLAIGIIALVTFIIRSIVCVISYKKRKVIK